MLRGGTKMNHMDLIIERNDRYQGDLTSPPGVDLHNASESGVGSQVSSKAKPASGETEKALAERERQLESWMDQVKLFIRNIDIERL
jgi:hypothetical protein